MPDRTAYNNPNNRYKNQPNKNPQPFNAYQQQATPYVYTNSQHKPRISQSMRKALLSGFLIFTFVGYAVTDRVSNAQLDKGALTPASPQVASTPQAAIPNTVRGGDRGGFGRDDEDGEQPNAPAAAQSAPQNNTNNNANSSANNTTNNAGSAASTTGYKDGQYTGQTADAYWGTVQVKAVIQHGQITDVQFVDYPHDRRTSQRINSQAMPWLKQEAIQAQNAQVDIISGATLTSEAFVQSLQSALAQAHS